MLTHTTLQDEIVREAQTMRQQSHPCVLPLYCSFVHEQNLWMVMPYVAGGSVLNIMKYAYPEVWRLLFFCQLGLLRHAFLRLVITHQGQTTLPVSCAGIGGTGDCHHPEGSPEGLGVYAQAGRYPSGREGALPPAYDLLPLLEPMGKWHGGSLLRGG